MRLNQFLAKSLGVSRRQGDKLIQGRCVSVNEQEGKLFMQVNHGDEVRVWQNKQWERISWPNDESTVLFYKPIFSVTTRSDPQKRKTIYDFLPKTYHNLKPAGRLDYMSEGLIILSSDGDLLQKLTHPKHGGKKLYLVELNTCFKQSEVEQMTGGMELEGYPLNPMRVFQDPELLQKYSFLKLDRGCCWFFFELTEGRNQQIRKVCSKFNKKVHRLIRLKHEMFEVNLELYKKKHLVVDHHQLKLRET